MPHPIDSQREKCADCGYEKIKGKNCGCPLVYTPNKSNEVSGEKEIIEKVIGEIGAKLLARHSPQIVLDAYFDVANEVIEQHENNN